MSFVLCSLIFEKKIALISFSGNHLAKFGFEVGCKVLVDISKGKIVIKAIDEVSLENSNNKRFERV